MNVVVDSLFAIARVPPILKIVFRTILETNFCQSFPCGQNGECFPEINGPVVNYTCVCYEGWQGRNCNIRSEGTEERFN